MGKMCQDTLHRNPRPLDHWFANHNLGISDGTLGIGWLFFVHSIHLPREGVLAITLLALRIWQGLVHCCSSRGRPCGHGQCSGMVGGSADQGLRCASTMPKIQDLYTALKQAVHDDIGRACHYQFASTWTLAGPPK